MELVRRSHLVLRDRRSPSADAEIETDLPSFVLVAAILADVVVSGGDCCTFVDLLRLSDSEFRKILGRKNRMVREDSPTMLTPVNGAESRSMGEIGLFVEGGV